MTSKVYWNQRSAAKNQQFLLKFGTNQVDTFLFPYAECIVLLQFCFLQILRNSVSKKCIISTSEHTMFRIVQTDYIIYNLNNYINLIANYLSFGV